MHRSVALAALLLALSSCTLGGSETQVTAAGIEARIGVAEPEGVVWQREVLGEVILGTTLAASQAEIDLLGRALSEVPEAIRRQADVRNIVRAGDSERTDPATLAFARGPDIYLIDRTFVGASRLDLAYTMAHELAHIAQFNELDPVLVDEVLAGRVDTLDPNTASLDVQDFSESIGWEVSGGVWVNADAATGTTIYGATGPSEDMAESIALVATGRANELSAGRVAWVEEWTGVPATEMARGKPWRPPGASVFGSPDSIFDAETVSTLGGRHIEPLYLLLTNDDSLDAIADEVIAELFDRGMAGQLDVISDDRLRRLGGRFVRPGGALLWVELWDFRDAPTFTNPPPGVVLTYVDVWS